MIVKLYWVARIAAYVACLAGILTYLYHQPDADPSVRNLGLGLVGGGFVAFFISYAVRAWLRFGPARAADKEG